MAPKTTRDRRILRLVAGLGRAISSGFASSVQSGAGYRSGNRFRAGVRDGENAHRAL